MTLSFKMTQEDFTKAMKLHVKQQNKSIWFFILSLSVTYFLLSTSFESSKSIISNVLTVVSFLIFYWVLLYFSRRALFKKQYNTNPVYQNEIHYTFNDEGVRSAHHNGNGFLKWEGFRDYKENESIYLIYLSPYLMYILPKSIMSEEEKKKLNVYLDTYLSKSPQVSNKNIKENYES